MNYTLRLLTIALVTLFSVTSTIAQNSNFISFTVEDGLVMSQVETIAQDHEGNLWIGTIAGLSKYNGYTFQNYSQKQGMAEDWVSASYFSESGKTLWLGHRGGGISVLRDSENQFIDLELENSTKYNRITAITEDADGNIWIATEQSGVVKYDTQSQKTTSLNKELTSQNIKSLYVDANGALWITTDRDINVYDVTNNKIATVLDASNILSDNVINMVTQAMGNEMWIATGNSGVLRVKLPTSINKYSTELDDENAVKYLNTENGLTSDNILTMLEDAKHNVWISTKANGIFKYSLPSAFRGSTSDFAKGQLNTYSNRFEKQYSFANTFFEDREGNIWMGTELGLYKYMGELFNIYNRYDNLVNNLVWSITEDENKNMWYGTSKGVSRFTFPLANGVRQYHNPVVKNFGNNKDLANSIVISMEVDGDNLWLGTEHNGVFVIDVESGKTQKTFNIANGLSDNKIYAICKDKNGDMWLGTNKGVTKINKDGSSESYTKEDGLGGDKVYNIYRDSKDRLWLGILGGDLTMYDGNSFKTFASSKETPTKFIISIVEDKQQNIWFAAYGDGVLKYDGSNFSLLGIKDGMHSNSPQFITCDNEGVIWIGQNIGIEKFDPNENKFTLYGKQQGFIGMETNENAVYRDQVGNVWFGTVRGVVKFDPKKDLINLKEPLININNMEIFMKNENMVAEASFSHDQNYITFKSQGICLTNPKELNYKYKLDGFQSDWSEPTSTGDITYSNLRPGKYTFNVIACNNNGIWNKTPATYSFVITPPFWETWWFYTLCGISLVLIVLSYIKVRERKLMKTQALLEQQVEERTQELRKEKEVVEAKNVVIEKINKNITESINYAKRIQTSILPAKNVVDKLVPESFILFKPKDIVSGDFYWVHKKENKVYIAAVDCTGHGVPGAFMSLIGYSALEKILNANGTITPAEVLNKLSVEIATMLRQGTDSESVKDGMDLAVCAIDTQNSKLEFAGAYNPLYLVRNKELQELKANKTPIGKGSAKEGIAFDNQIVDLQKDDTIYMFSDGYADQKGGPKKKKFYYPPFRKLLADISDLPMEEQKTRLDKNIEDWRGDVEQYDDVLVVGVKIS